MAPISITPREHTKLVRGPGDQLVIILDPLDEIFHGRGYYGSDGTKMPVRYRFLRPEAHESLKTLEAAYPACFYFTDVFRNASGSRGRRKKNRAKRIRQGKSAIYTGKKPGFSAHSFGLCFDLDVKRTLRNLQRITEDAGFDKADLDAVLKEHGWWCHRDGPNGGDHRRGHEDWHFNFFGDDPDRWLSHSNRKTSRGVEAKVMYENGPFTLNAEGVEEHLMRLGYNNASKAAIQSFQRDWTLDADGIAGPDTQRTLLYVGARIIDTNADEIEIAFP
jgi:hypothetical protein